MKEQKPGSEQQDLEQNEGLKAFIRRVVREEMKRILDEQLRSRGWQEMHRPGPQERKEQT